MKHLLFALLLCTPLVPSHATTSTTATCHNAWSPLTFPRSTPLLYSFKVEQSIEARLITSVSSLYDIVDRNPERPFAHVEGTLTLTPQCRETLDKTIFRATMSSVTLSCKSSKKQQIQQCLAHWGELEMDHPPFWFSWSRAGTISDIRTSTLEGSQQIAQVQSSLVQVLGQQFGNLNCTTSIDDNNDTIRQYVEYSRGVHGQDPTQSYSSQTFRIHRLSGPSSVVPLPSTTHHSVTKALSRTAFVLDVHGKTKTNRSRPQHFVHTSSEIVLLSSSHQDEVHNPNNSISKKSTCSSDDLRAREERLAVSSSSSLIEATSSKRRKQQTLRTLAQMHVDITPGDMAKHVTGFLTLITESRQKLEPGFLFIKTAIDEIEKTRTELFGDDLFYCVDNQELSSIQKGVEAVQDGATAAEEIKSATTLRLAALARGEDPEDSTETARLPCEKVEECGEDSRYNEKATCEKSNEGLIGHGIDFLLAAERTVKDTKRQLQRIMLPAESLEELAEMALGESLEQKKVWLLEHHVKPQVETLVQHLSTKVDTAIDFFVQQVVKVLDDTKDFMPVIAKNLQPLTEMLAKLLRTLGPAGATAQDATEAITAGIQTQTTLSQIPASFTKQWTDSEVYQTVFERKTGAISKLLAFLNHHDKNDAEGENGLEKYFEKAITDLLQSAGAIIKDPIRTVLTELKNTFVAFSLKQMHEITVDDVEKALVAAGDQTGVSKEVKKLKEDATSTVKDAIKGVKGATALVSLSEDPKLKMDFSSLVNVATKVNKVLVTLEKKLDELEKGVVAAREKAQDFAESMNDKMQQMVKKTEAGLKKIDNVIFTTKIQLEKIAIVLSEGKSFSKRKHWKIGLMKNWNAEGYAQGAISFSPLPKPNAQAELILGINYKALKPSRGGSLVELSISEGVSVEESTNSLDALVGSVKFDPPLKALTPMLSVLGSPPIPISSNPVAMLEIVLPTVQKRILGALSDTSWYFPTIMTFLDKHVLQVPIVKRAIGGFQMTTEKDGKKQWVFQDVMAQLGKKRDDFCNATKTKATSELDKRATLVKAFKTTYDLNEQMLESLKQMWLPISALAEAVSANLDQQKEEELADIKDVVCLLQDRFFANRDQICTDVVSTMRLVGSEAEATQTLFMQAASAIDCSEDAETVRLGFEGIYDRLEASSRDDSPFAICDVEPVITTCDDVKGSTGFVTEKSAKRQEMSDNFFLLGKLLRTVMDAATKARGKESKLVIQEIVLAVRTLMSPVEATLGETEASIDNKAAVIGQQQAAVAEDHDENNNKDNDGAESPTEFIELNMRIKEDVWNIIDQELKKFQDLETNSVVMIVDADQHCRNVVKTSISTSNNLIKDFKTLYNSIEKLLEEHSDNPERMLPDIANIYSDVKTKAHHYMGIVPDFEKSFDICTAALEKGKDTAQDSGATKVLSDKANGVQSEKSKAAQKKAANQAVKMIQKMKNILPMLRGPMQKVAEVAGYISDALLCWKKMISPVKEAIEIAMNIINSDTVDPYAIKISMEQIAEAFEPITTCAKRDIVDPLDNLLGIGDLVNDAKNAIVTPESEEMAAKAKEMAYALYKLTPVIPDLVRAGIRIYGIVTELVPVIEAFLQNVQIGEGGFQESIGAVRNFKTGLTETIMALRELRELLQYLPTDDDTMLAIFESADKTMVGLEAACDVVIGLIELHQSTSQIHDQLDKKIFTGFVELENSRMRSSSGLRGVGQEKLLGDSDVSIPTSESDSASMVERLRALEQKIDMLQETSDKISSKVTQARGVQSRAHSSMLKGRGESTSDASLRRESNKFQKGIEASTKVLSCPLTHFALTPPEKKLLISKDVDLIVEEITVPPTLTYGIDVKIGIMIRAVANAYMNSVTCDCKCSLKMSSPCSEILKLGLSLDAHILGTGSLSVGVKILKISGTVNLQLASMYADSILSIGRVAKDITNDLCVKKLPPDKASFGSALEANLALEILRGSFKADVSFLGISAPIPRLNWKGLRWDLASYCYEPPRTEKKPLRQLSPNVCPIRTNRNFQPMPTVVKASARPTDVESKHSCSICQINEEDEEGGWTCKHPPSRVLALAGYSDLQHVESIGSHFQQFLRQQHEALTERVLFNSLGYLTDEAKQMLEEDLKKYGCDGTKCGEKAKKPRSPLIHRLFTNTNAAKSMVKKLNSKFKSDLASETAPNKYKYISNIFLCGERVNVKEDDATKEKNLVYTGNIFIRYNLNGNLRSRAASSDIGKDTATAATSGVSNLKTMKNNINTEADRMYDVLSPFTVPFKFHVTMPRSTDTNSLSRLWRRSTSWWKGITYKLVAQSKTKWEAMTTTETGINPTRVEFKMMALPKLNPVFLELIEYLPCTRIDSNTGKMEDTKLKTFSKSFNAQKFQTLKTNKLKQANEFLEIKMQNLKGVTKVTKEAAGWTKARCSGCCMKNQKPFNTKSYREVDKYKRSCGTGKTYTFGGTKATEKQCTEGCSDKNNIESHDSEEDKAVKELYSSSTTMNVLRDRTFRVRLIDYDTYQEYRVRYAAPDPVSEFMALDWSKGLESKSPRTLSRMPMLTLPPTKNVFQVSLSGNGAYYPGTLRDSCFRPWLFGDKPMRDLFIGNGAQAHEGPPMADELCDRLYGLLAQNVSDGVSTGHTRYQAHSYSQFRSIAIEQLDAQPCSDRSLDPSNGYSFGTQMCFRCIHNEGTWRCPLTGRRNGAVIAAAATWLDARPNCPRRATNANKQYSESDYVRTIFYTQAQRIENYLAASYDVAGETIKSVTLCGEAISPSIYSSSEVGPEASSGDNSGLDKQFDPLAGVRGFGDDCKRDASHGEGCDPNQGLICGKSNRCVHDEVSDLWKGKVQAGKVCYKDSECAETDLTKEAMCIQHICVMVGSSLPIARPNQHALCRTNADCSSIQPGKAQKEGNCVLKSDSFFNTGVDRTHVFKDDDPKPKAIGICESDPSALSHGSLCIKDSECKQGGGRCDEVTRRCVMKDSVEPCYPCLQTGTAQNAEGNCAGSVGLYSKCARCEKDDDCAPLPDGAKVVCSYPWYSWTALTGAQLAGGEEMSGKDNKAGKKICLTLKKGGDSCNLDIECGDGERICRQPNDLQKRYKKDFQGKEYQRLSGSCSFPNTQAEGSKCTVGIECKAPLVCHMGRMFDDTVSNGKFVDLMNNEQLLEQVVINKFDALPEKISLEEKRKLLKEHFRQKAIEKFDYKKNYGSFTSTSAGEKLRRQAERKAYVSAIPSAFSTGVCGEKEVAAYTSKDVFKISASATSGLFGAQDRGRCGNFDFNQETKENSFMYTGIAYVDILSSNENSDLRRASDTANPALHVFNFKLLFSIKNMALSDFILRPDASTHFLEPIEDTCATTDNNGQISKEYRRTCIARDAYRTIFGHFTSAYENEMQMRDPCRIEPEIDAHEYVKKNSPFVFFGWPLGQHTVDGTKTVRSNKKCFLCSLVGHNIIEDENGKKGFGSSVGKQFKDHVTNRNGGAYRCKFNHMGNNVDRNVQTAKRIASLNLFDEEMVKSARARQILDRVVETVLKTMQHDSFGGASKDQVSGSFWNSVGMDQLESGRHEENWLEQDTQVAVCDELGMDNMPVTQILTGKTSRLLPRKSSTTELYGGTICARRGWEFNCVQYVLPFQDMIEASDATLMEEDSKRGKNDEDIIGGILKRNLRIWHGEGVKETSTEDNLMNSGNLESAKVGDNGHEYFFEVFLAAIMQSETDGQKKINQCATLDELQVPEENNGDVVEDGCGDDETTKNYCAIPSTRGVRYTGEGEKMSDRIVHGAELCDGVSEKSADLEDQNAQYIFAQRYVNPETCEDLVAPSKKEFARKKVASAFLGDKIHWFHNSKDSAAGAGLIKGLLGSAKAERELLKNKQNEAGQEGNQQAAEAAQHELESFDAQNGVDENQVSQGFQENQDADATTESLGTNGLRALLEGNKDGKNWAQRAVAQNTNADFFVKTAKEMVQDKKSAGGYTVKDPASEEAKVQASQAVEALNTLRAKGSLAIVTMESIYSYRTQVVSGTMAELCISTKKGEQMLLTLHLSAGEEPAVLSKVSPMSASMVDLSSESTSMYRCTIYPIPMDPRKQQSSSESSSLLLLQVGNKPHKRTKKRRNLKQTRFKNNKLRFKETGTTAVRVVEKEDEELPLAWDVRVEHPQCKKTVEFITNQGTCGSCYAFAAGQTAAINACVAGHEIETLWLSVQDVLDCGGLWEGELQAGTRGGAHFCPRSDDKTPGGAQFASQSCTGGQSPNVFEYAAKFGLVDSTCQTYIHTVRNLSLFYPILLILLTDL